MSRLDIATNDGNIAENTDAELKKYLSGNTKWAGQSLYVYEETDSTNIRAKYLGESGAPHGTLVVAESQTAGRGRRGRSWNSGKDQGIYMSLLLRPEFAPDKASMLTLVMAYSVEKALKKCTGLDVQIKWPNDIVVNGKKLVGILTEMNLDGERIGHVIIGVGINVNMEAFSEDLCGKATSLRIETDRTFSRNLLIAEVLKAFEEDYERFLETEDLLWMRESYNACLVNCGRDVMIHGVSESYHARALGINDAGELLVRRENGIEETIYAGEVSVRGVYGYV